MKTIYILDDEQPILDVLSLWFQRQNYLVKTFENTNLFLQALLVQKPSLAIIDIILAGEDGRQLCLLVKAKYGNHLPIILISAAPNLGKVYKEYEADAFVAKPFDLHSLKEIVSTYI